MLRGRVALSDPEITRLIKQNFVAAVGEHMQLTRGPHQDWWMTVVKTVRPDYPGGSTQGYYILRADGTGIAVDNHPPRMKSYLERGLAAHRQGGRRAAKVTPDDLKEFAPPPMPDGASVIRLFTRAKLADGADPENSWLNRDYMWVLRDEVEEILSSGNKSPDSFVLPRTLVARLIVFHMVDGTRGQVWPYRPQDVSKARFTAKVLGSNGTNRTISFTGDYAKRDSHPPQWNDRGQEGQIDGEFDIDTRTKKITRFRAYADSQAWTDATYDPRRPPTGRYRLLTAVVEATGELAEHVAPEPAGTGDYYLRSEIPTR